MRKITVITALAVLLVPSTALAAGTPTRADRANAQRDCRALRDSMGVETFRATYGTNANKSNAFGKCVSRWGREERENRQNAAQECKAEREADQKAFAEKYATFGKCVSGKRKAESRADREEVLNAAKACKAEREADEKAFAETYATFGKCVSAHAPSMQREDT